VRHRNDWPALLVDENGVAVLPCDHEDHDDEDGCVSVHGPAQAHYLDGILGCDNQAALVIDRGGWWHDRVWDIRIDGPAEFWYRDNTLDRNDGPAIESTEVEHWFRNGKRHRDHGPATTWSSGTRVWYHDGQLDRANGPAIEYDDGRQEWWRRDHLHRDDGPAVILPEGEWGWYPDEVNFLASNWEPSQSLTPEGWAIDGPARIWMRDGRYDRSDGPAVEGPGDRREYWIEGHPFSEREWLAHFNLGS
jgi:hypothetical protein